MLGGETINTPPTVNAGTNKTTEVNQPVTITGTGTDTDGPIVSYEWTENGEFLSDTASFGYIPTAVPGTYTLTLTVMDNDGATGTSEIIVDNRDSGFSTVGRWSESGASDEYAGSSVYSKTANNSATWAPVLPETGSYEVYVWYSGSTSYARDPSVAYTVTHALGADTIAIDQDQGSGAWVSLGVFNFNAGTGANITLVRQTTSTASTSADAVKFVLLGSI